LLAVRRLWFAFASFEATVSSVFISSPFQCLRFHVSWPLGPSSVCADEYTRRRPWWVPLGFFPSRTKDLGKVALFPSLSRCLQFGESWSLGLVPRAPRELSPRPAMASAVRDFPRPRKWHGRGRHHLRVTLVLSVCRTVARWPYFLCSGKLLAVGHGSGAAVATVPGRQLLLSLSHPFPVVDLEIYGQD
jgi:hypothetical protein